MRRSIVVDRDNVGTVEQCREKPNGYEWSSQNILTPGDALKDIVEGVDEEKTWFDNEYEYREWFIESALVSLAPYITGGGTVTQVGKEQIVIGSRLRIDVLAETDNGYILGFELKAVNPRYMQNHAFAVMQGVGQTLLYEDYLREAYGDLARVFLVSDSITERVARFVMRHDYIINLIEATPLKITCIAREEIGRG